MYKKDIKLFLIIIPLINAFNYYLTYTHISLSWHTTITFMIDTLQGYAAWAAIRYIIRWLDDKISFTLHPKRRIVAQILATVLIGLVIVISLTVITNLLFSKKPIPKSFFTEDIFIFSIWCLVVNGIYVAWHYFELWQHAEILHTEKSDLLNKLKQPQAQGITVKLGKKTRIVAYDEIAGFLIENEYAFVCTLDSGKYILDASLDKIEQKLPAELFFRVNRQLIAHRQIIAGYKRIDNGKIELQFKNQDNFTASAQLSRTKAPAFKQWIEPDTTDQSYTLSIEQV